MAYQNVKGTTNRTFKIGPRGVELSTKAIVSTDEEGKEKLTKYLAVRQKDGSDRALAFKDEMDAFISSSEIKTISFSNNQVTIILRKKDENGNEIRIPILSGTGAAGDVKGPETSTPDAVALFEGSTGKQLKDSKKVICDTISDEAHINDIPTIGAIVGYVGEISKPLENRLNGH